MGDHERLKQVGASSRDLNTLQCLCRKEHLDILSPLADPARFHNGDYVILQTQLSDSCDGCANLTVFGRPEPLFGRRNIAIDYRGVDRASCCIFRGALRQNSYCFILLRRPNVVATLLLTPVDDLMVRKTKKQKSYLTPLEVAELLMVSPTTVRQLASEGKIRSSVTPGGHRRFQRMDVETFSRERGLTLQLPDDQTIRILIVDDDVDIASVLTRLLKRADPNIQTMTASSGFDTGRMVQEFRPHFLLLDIMMPGIDGIEVCKTIKQDPSSKAMRVIAMTGFYEDATVKRILDAGAELCLKKPFSTEALLSALGISADTIGSDERRKRRS